MNVSISATPSAGDVPIYDPTKTSKWSSVPLGQHRIAILGVTKLKSSSGSTTGKTTSTNSQVGGYRSATSPGALNDTWTWYEDYLAAGTWSLELDGAQGTNGPIITAKLVPVNLPGVATLTFPNTQDQYAAAGAAVTTDMGAVTVAKAGFYSLQAVATGRNASNSVGYLMRIALATLYKTA